jgi:hypothetical protein
MEQYQLTYDSDFVYRGRSCTAEQAMTFKDDTRGDIAALGNAVLTNVAGPQLTFQTLLGGAPGFADAATLPDGGVDSSLITDGQILSAVQAFWPTVAALYFNPDGTGKT